MSIFGALKGKLHKKSLDEEIDEAFGEKEPFSKRVLEANKKLDGEEDPEYNKFAGRSAESFQPKPLAEASALSPHLRLQEQEFSTPVVTRQQPPSMPEPLAVRKDEQTAQFQSPQHQQLASKIQALQRKHAMPEQQTETALPPTYTQHVEPTPTPVENSSDLHAEIQELKEQNKKIIEILRDIQKNLRI